MIRLLGVPLATLVLGFAACGGDGAESGEPAGDSRGQTTAEAEPARGTDDSKPTRPQDEPARGIAIATLDSQFGPILFDGEDRAIYYFDKEELARSECYGACAEAWPPVLTEGEPVADGGADQGLLGTTKRDDGSTQVTYDGRPLYYYVDDPAGQALCHNVEEFGGLWLVVQPDGGTPA